MMGAGDDDDAYQVPINLTALLDVLTNLLFFLMLGLAAQTLPLDDEADLRLPRSSADGAPIHTVQVSIGARELRVDKQSIARLREGAVVGLTGRRIVPLYQRLLSIRGERGGEKNLVGDVIMLHCDEETPYALLQQVLDTAAEAGFGKFRMAVLMP